MDQSKHPINVILHKHKEMIYFSQLDIFHVLKLALRRTSLPVYYTQGFNPHAKISFLNGLKLGQEGELRVVFYFSEYISGERFKSEMIGQLPQGLEILTIS